MGRPILVVYVNGGSYSNEDEFEKALIATYDVEVAERYIRRRKALDRLHDRREEAIKAFRKQYYAENPSPRIDDSQRREHVRWASGLRKEQITDEMKAERKEINDHNQRLYDAHTALHAAWSEKFEEACIAFLRTIKVPPKKMEHFIEDSCYTKRAETWRYSIRKLRVI